MIIGRKEKRRSEGSGKSRNLEKYEGRKYEIMKGRTAGRNKDRNEKAKD